MGTILKPGDLNGRVPPGQYLTTKFPVLTYGAVPRFNPQTWDLQIFGEVESPLRLEYAEFRALTRTRQVADFHCVTTWSRLDNQWEGVMASDLVKLVKPKPTARFVLIHCDGGYTTNLPLENFLDHDVMLADRHDGEDLSPDHGFPAALGGAQAVCVEKRQMGARNRVPGSGQPRFLGSAGLSQPRRSVARRTLLVPGTGRITPKSWFHSRTVCAFTLRSV